MRTTLPVTTTVAVVSILALMVLPGCHHGEPPPSGNRGVFYQRTAGQNVPLLLGTALEMAPRAISVGSAVRPSFLIDLPSANISEVRIAVNLVDGKGGPFQRIDVTALPVEGKPGVYTVSAKIDLPTGLCAIVIGFDDRVLDDRNNVYPFIVAGENAAQEQGAA